MRYLPDGKWMQKADTHTIQEIGIPSMVLMERAALQIVAVMEERKIDLTNALIVCGAGNNGGDGFAVARLLWQKGFRVTVVFVGKESSRSEECRTQMEIAGRIGVPIVTEVPHQEYSVIIDAVFGVGLCREIIGHYAEVIETMNSMRGTKVAVDIPSGISSFTGEVLGTAFQAELTIAFQCEKLGTVLYPGREYSGAVIVTEIGIDTGFYKDKSEIAYALEYCDIKKRLPKRKENSHKGTYGKVLMITGSPGMAGAAYLSAKAAYTCGAGLVQIYTSVQNRTILQQLLPEAIISTYEEYSKKQLEQLLDWADVVCMGCGLGRSTVSEELVEGTLASCKVPCVIDADGINLLARRMDLLKNATCPIVLTPHMKEMAGMLGCTVPELVKERFLRLSQITEQYPVICALKDARTVVSENTHPMFVNTAGNSAMAKAGSGDVLSGVITGLMAQHMSAYDSAVLGVYLHACGGDEARYACGCYSVLAEDLIQGIAVCLKKNG